MSPVSKGINWDSDQLSARTCVVFHFNQFWLVIQCSTLVSILILILVSVLYMTKLQVWISEVKQYNQIKIRVIKDNQINFESTNESCVSSTVYKWCLEHRCLTRKSYIKAGCYPQRFSDYLKPQREYLYHYVLKSGVISKRWIEGPTAWS